MLNCNAVNDLPNDSSPNEPCYYTWLKILKNCYGEHAAVRAPRKITKEWLLFSNFKKWFDENYTEGYVLSINMIDRENDTYHPNKCLFVPQDLQLFINRKSKGGRTQGHMNKRAAEAYPEFSKYLIGVK